MQVRYQAALRPEKFIRCMTTKARMIHQNSVFENTLIRLISA